MTRQTDTELLQSFASGERRAHAQIVAWIRELTNAKLWAGSLTADDIVGEAVYRLLEIFRGEKFRFESSLKTFVQRVARNVLLDYVRTVRRLDDYVKTLDPEPIETSNDPLEELLEKERIALYHRVLHLLPKACRELYHMLFVEELTHKELAAKVGRTTGSSKTAWSRCMDKAAELAETIG